MKKMLSGIALVMVLAFSGCGGDDDPKPDNGGSADLGTFAGNIQVSNDPTTDVGYIYNVTAKVTRSGDEGTVVITGDLGFNRTYKGTINTSTADTFDMSITRQTAPSDKIAGDRLIILGNKLTVSIDLASDNITARQSPAAVESMVISGKIQMIGTDLLRQ
jgi:hypothetical protein